MPKFIKSNTIVEINRHNVETNRQVLFTDDEVVSRVLLNPSLVIEVTESHATQVVRVQGKYQELSEDLLETIDTKRTEQTKALGKKTPAKPETPVEVEGLDEPAEETDSGDSADEAPLSFGKK